MALTTQQRKEKMLAALKLNIGVVGPSCEAAMVARKTYYNWLKKDKKFAQQVHEIQDYQIDYVENKMMKRIEAGSERMIQFFLETRAKHRGYTKRTEIVPVGAGDLPAPKFIFVAPGEQPKEKDDA